MSELYWITRLDAVCGILIAVMFVAGVAMAVGIMSWITDDDIKERARGRKILRYSLITFLVSVNGFYSLKIVTNEKGETCKILLKE